MDALTLAIILPIAPMVVLIFIWTLARRKDRKSGRSRDLGLLLGFLSVTLAYIFMPNPYSIYSGEGVDLTAMSVFSCIALGFLVVAVFVFKSHRKG